MTTPRPMRHLKCSGSDVASVACGWNHTLVALSNGEVYSFGSNEYGQLAQPFSKTRPGRLPHSLTDSHTLPHSHTHSFIHYIDKVACGHRIVNEEAAQGSLALFR